MPEASSIASLNRWARGIAKSVAAHTGGVRLYHRLRDRTALTVIMLHRVLPQAMFADSKPDPGYTISTDVLNRLAHFLKANYSVVGLQDVLEARRHHRPLPAHPLLVTFDDGWDDNLRHAAPILAAHNIPWTLFVAADAVSGTTWWQETLLKTLRLGHVSYPDLSRMAGGTGAEPAGDSSRELALLETYGALDSGHRDTLLARFEADERQFAPHMASWDALRGRAVGDVSIGVHGFSHLPLTLFDNPQEDLQRARELLRGNLGASVTASMSFPHGRYNSKVVAAARALGFELMFTSDAVLNDCPGGYLPYDMIGRISVEGSWICDDRGEFDSSRAERWLMLRKRQAAA